MVFRRNLIGKALWHGPKLPLAKGLMEINIAFITGGVRHRAGGNQPGKTRRGGGVNTLRPINADSHRPAGRMPIGLKIALIWRWIITPPPIWKFSELLSGWRREDVERWLPVYS